MKRNLTLLTCMFFVVVGFIGCSDESGNGRGAVGRLVVAIDYEYCEEDYEEKEFYSYEFQYDDVGRLTDMMFYYNGHEEDHAEYTYSANTIYLIDSNCEETIEWKLNTRGLVNTRVLSSDDYEYVYRYNYGTDGLLSSVSSVRLSMDNTSQETEYERANGNIVRVSYTQKDNLSGSAYIREYYYTYTNHVDKSNLDIMAVIGNTCLIYPCDITEIDKTTFKSLGNKNLPKSFRSPIDNENWTFTYDFDKSGDLKEIDVFLNDKRYIHVSVKYNN